jgi:cell division protein FtsW (lipid II flippase)
MSTQADAQKLLEQRRGREKRQGRAHRTLEFLLLVVASVAVASGLWLVYQAKRGGFDEAAQAINLNAIHDSTQLLPLLSDISDSGERQYVAGRILEQLRHGGLPNVGALGRLRVAREDLALKPGMARLKQRVAAAGPRNSASLLTGTQIRNLKPLLVVRTPAAWRNSVLLWCGMFFACFIGLHLFWRYTRFAGDNFILPTIELLSGAGLILMISLRDPLRDTLMFRDFAQGLVGGAILMAAMSLPDYARQFRRYMYVFIIATLLLGIALATFGTGPGGSDAKVNLLFFQPVEMMRILIVFFLAGYFAQHWDVLRDLRHKGGPLTQHFHVPRLDYVLPVAVSVVVAVFVFVGLKDNGPALIIGALFLILYGVARKQYLGTLIGFLLIAGAFWAGHLVHFPSTVAARVDMWKSPWRNVAPGGDQIAHSVWALASGGLTGAGPGNGSPSLLPAGHTDLILAAAGEEFGFIGLAIIVALYGVLVWRSVRAALNAPDTYSFFLVTGLNLIVALQLVLIAGGILGLIPLSGVVSPFLSFGRTSMVANFAAFAIILSVTSREVPGANTRNFGVPTYAIAGTLAFCGVAILARAAYFQTARADDFLIRDAEVRFADRSIGLEYNPRLREALRQIVRGDVVDRNGLPLASSEWDSIEKHREQYRNLGISIDNAQSVSRNEKRHYPLGPEFFYLVGDERSTLRRGASATAFQERQSRVRLQGFDDRRELIELTDPANGQTTRVYRYDYTDVIPLVRHRHEPDSPEVKRFLERQRNVQMSIDAAFQLKASAILRKHLAAKGQKGAIVVLNPANGDLLAAVSYPWPEPAQFAAFRANPDRTMEAEFQDRARFGLYPPGSSFKIVTAVAALRAKPDTAPTKAFECKSLGDGRVGNYVGGSKRPIRDDVMDRVPHGTVDLEKGIIVSCNAYFAQLGWSLGPEPLFDTAREFGILVARPNTPERLKESLPQASYGQGEVVVTPFQLARVAATIANHGNMPQGRWILDDTNTRIEQPTALLDPNFATQLGRYMREVVTSPAGTGKVLSGSKIPIAGKTGTAELLHAVSHAWFIGFAPYDAPKQIAFAVLVEHGQYGGRAAAPIAGEIVQAAKEAGLI